MHESVCNWLKENEAKWTPWIENLPKFEQEISFEMIMLTIFGGIVAVSIFLYALHVTGTLYLISEFASANDFYSAV